MKQKYTKAEMKKYADVEIIARCLYESYTDEYQEIKNGSIQKTISLQFLRMLHQQIPECSVEQLHQEMWRMFLQENEEKDFAQKVQEQLLDPICCKRERKQMHG